MVIRLTPDEIRRSQKREKESRWRWWRRQIHGEAMRRLRERYERFEDRDVPHTEVVQKALQRITKGS